MAAKPTDPLAKAFDVIGAQLGNSPPDDRITILWRDYYRFLFHCLPPLEFRRQSAMDIHSLMDETLDALSVKQ